MLLEWRLYTTIVLTGLGMYLLVRTHGARAAKELLPSVGSGGASEDRFHGRFLARDERDGDGGESNESDAHRA